MSQLLAFSVEGMSYQLHHRCGPHTSSAEVVVGEPAPAHEEKANFLTASHLPEGFASIHRAVLISILSRDACSLGRARSRKSEVQPELTKFSY